MLHYLKFDIYLPVEFTDPSGEKRNISSELTSFSREMRKKFGGFTETNPVTAPPFKGWWESKGITYIDYIVYIFTLVKLRDEETAKKFFGEWKSKLEKKLNQEVVLICFHPIQTFSEI